MSVRKILGAIAAIIIGAILLHLALLTLSTVIALPLLAIQIIWGLAGILAIFVLCWALEINIPFVRW